MNEKRNSIAKSYKKCDALLVKYDDNAKTCFKVANSLDSVVTETRADIFVGDKFWTSVAVSPMDLEDFAYGFAFSAGVITSASDVISVEIKYVESRLSIFIALREGINVEDALAQANLQQQIPTNCPAPDREVAPSNDDVKVSPSAIFDISEKLLPMQSLHLETGASHAAAFATVDGDVVLLREDVGRHSAVEKLVGCLLRSGIDASSGFVYLSSRCALELVRKLSGVGVKVVATVSAPTSAVLDFAKESGITLCAYARPGRFTIYANPKRIAID